MTREIIFAPEAEEDLLRIYEHIAGEANAERAAGYVERIVAHCMNLKVFPESGRQRDDIMRGMRTIGFERRVVIAYRLTTSRVVILAVRYGGQGL